MSTTPTTPTIPGTYAIAFAAIAAGLGENDGKVLPDGRIVVDGQALAPADAARVLGLI